jgi:hypothetical protein
LVLGHYVFCVGKANRRAALATCTYQKKGWPGLELCFAFLYLAEEYIFYREYSFTKYGLIRATLLYEVFKSLGDQTVSVFQ